MSCEPGKFCPETRIPKLASGSAAADAQSRSTEPKTLRLKQMLSRRLVVLDAPSNLGLAPPSPGREPGVRKLPDALRKRGLLSRLAAIDGGRVDPPPYNPRIDPEFAVRNARPIASFAYDVAERLDPILSDGDFPILLGGDCSILLGPLLALRRLGAFGLCFIDGHLDLLTPATSHTKGAAGMDLALAIGHGPKILADLDGYGPLVMPRDVVVVGFRGDIALCGELANGADRPRFLWNSLDEVRLRGAKEVADLALARFKERDIRGFWVHLDVDVLDDGVMPAVDSRQPDGLTYPELGDLMKVLLDSPDAVGIDITILDPELDPKEDITDSFVDFLEDLF